MASFSQDPKWIEAKEVVGKPNWIEVVSYYRHIGGTNVFVYCIGDGDKKLIVDVVDDDNNVLLINKFDEPVIEGYENVLSSRKQFSYSEDFENRTYEVQGKKVTIAIERK